MRFRRPASPRLLLIVTVVLASLSLGVLSLGPG